MAERALTAGPTGRRRVLFGLLDADSWSWATVKAFFWFVVIAMLIGYLPDRAYYFTVFPTIDLGLNVWSPVNFCPPENETLPCPAPGGSTLPWQGSPAELALPAPRTEGGVVQIGTRMMYIGGTDGKAATDTTFVSDLYGGNFGPWKEAGKLPAARSAAGVAALNAAIYVAGGYGVDGKTTDTVYVASQDLATGKLSDFAADASLKLPATRAAGVLLAASDGLIFIGGTDGKTPQPTVWKATLNKAGKLGPWAAQAALPTGIAEASAGLVGDHLFVYGGSDPNGPVGLVLRGNVSKDSATLGQIVSWDIGSGATNLPVARTKAAGFSSNGALYLVGGADSAGPHPEMYWTAPDPQGNMPAWQHLTQTDLPTGVAGSAPLLSGSNVFLIGGTTADQPAVSGSARANVAPAAPFFQLGLFGATVPALKIGGEVGQQLGYLNAANVAIIDFTILCLIGYAYAHPARTRAFFAAISRRLRG